MSVHVDTTHSRGFVRYYLGLGHPGVVVQTVGGPEELGRGWLVITEEEYFRLLGQLPTLKAAQSFIEGFRGDQHQEGVDVLLAEIAGAITRVEAGS